MKLNIELEEKSEFKILYFVLENKEFICYNTNNLILLCFKKKPSNNL